MYLPKILKFIYLKFKILMTNLRVRRFLYLFDISIINATTRDILGHVYFVWYNKYIQLCRHVVRGLTTSVNKRFEQLVIRELFVVIGQVLK